MTTRLNFGFALISLGMMGSAHAQNLLINSSFETGTHTVNAVLPSTTAVTNWTVTGAGELPWVTAGSTLTNSNLGQLAGGAKSINFIADTGINYFRQTVSLTNNKVYQVAMDVQLSGSANAGNSTLAVFFAAVNGTTPTQSFTFPAAATSTASMSSAWTSFANGITWTGGTGSFDLVYQFTGPGSVAKDINLDRVSLMMIPEPGALGLLALGGGFLGLLRRRRPV
jgi:Protein of unknown function (DUF642)